MADTEKSEQPQTNGLENGLDEDERSKLRPADIDADVKEMERRKRVEMIMSSKLFREELERIIELQMKDGNGPAGLLQQISDMMGIQSGKLHTTHMFRGSNCVTPINDIRGVESLGYEKGEKNLRCKLASVFRLMDLYGWSQGINNQITACLNQDEEHYLVNPHGMLYNEITASSLVKVDMQGNIVEPGTTNFSVNTQGFLLHSAIHASRPDVKCVIHIKTPSVLAVSSLKSGLLPLCQEALVIGEVSQHPFVSGIFEPEEREKIIRNLGPTNKVLLLHNHGAVCCGATVEEAFYNVYNTVLACETQIKLMPMGVENLVLVSDEMRKQVYDAAHRAPDAGAGADKKPKQFRVGELEFEALIRMLDNAGFRTGYIYRHPLVKGELPKPKNDVEVPPAVSSLGYLIEQEELYKQGNWKKYIDGRNRLDRTKWLNSPNVYQKVEILETGTTDPKKITKWVAESSPTHSSTPVKIDSALQFVPKGTNPKEFKKLQQQIKENRRADKITSGPQSHILEGVSWEEAKKLQDANITQTGDQVILVGAASKGIIQRNYQHNALVYKTPYAKNPFDSMSDKEIEDYKQLVERKQRGDTDYEESQSESEAISSSRQDGLRHLKSPLLSPQSATSETEDESRTEPRVLRIETKTAPRPIQAEVVLSDAESDTTDARVERSHSARYPKAEKPESVTLMNSFRKSWSLKREKEKNKDIEKPDGYDTRNLHLSLMLSECEQDRTESLHCCIARIKQLTHKPVIIDVGKKPLRPLLKSASDPCNLSISPEEDVAKDDNRQPGISKTGNLSLSCKNIANMSDLQHRLNKRKKSIYSAKMKFLGFHNGDVDSPTKSSTQEQAPTSPICALISEIRETINEIVSPDRSKRTSNEKEDGSDHGQTERTKCLTWRNGTKTDLAIAEKPDLDKLKSKISLNKTFQNLTGNFFDSITYVKPVRLESLDDLKKDFKMLPLESSEPDSEHISERLTISSDKPDKVTNEENKVNPKLDDHQDEEKVVENVVTEIVQMINMSDEEATYTITDDSLLQTYSFTETTETEWYYNKTILKLENSQTVVENKEVEAQEIPGVKNVDTGIDTDFTSDQECKKQTDSELQKEFEQSNTTEEIEGEVPTCETSGLNKSSETDSSLLKSSSGGRTSNDVDTSFAFKTDTENSEKNEKVQTPEKSSISSPVHEDKKKFMEEMLGSRNEMTEEDSEQGETRESKTPEIVDNCKQEEICHTRLPGIPESPEFTNVDTEDAPITSSSKETSPEVVNNATQFTEDEPMETNKEPEVDFEKDFEANKGKEKPRKNQRRKKNKKSSTKITVKKEMKEKNSSEPPVISEVSLTIKNSNECYQSEKYEVKIQEVTNSSEELSRSVSSVGENVDGYETFEIVNSSCDCEAQQNLEELQDEVSSTIEKLQTIENYFEDEIKKHSSDSPMEKGQSKIDDFTIEYNYREFEEVLNESKDELSLLEREEEFADVSDCNTGEMICLKDINENNVKDLEPKTRDLEKSAEHTKSEPEESEETGGNHTAEENAEYFLSYLLDNIGGEVEVGRIQEDVESISTSFEMETVEQTPKNETFYSLENSYVSDVMEEEMLTQVETKNAQDTTDNEVLNSENKTGEETENVATGEDEEGQKMSEGSDIAKAEPTLEASEEVGDVVAENKTSVCGEDPKAETESEDPEEKIVGGETESKEILNCPEEEKEEKSLPEGEIENRASNEEIEKSNEDAQLDLSGNLGEDVCRQEPVEDGSLLEEVADGSEKIPPETESCSKEEEIDGSSCNLESGNQVVQEEEPGSVPVEASVVANSSSKTSEDESCSKEEEIGGGDSSCNLESGNQVVQDEEPGTDPGDASVVASSSSKPEVDGHDQESDIGTSEDVDGSGDPDKIICDQQPEEEIKEDGSVQMESKNEELETDTSEVNLVSPNQQGSGEATDSRVFHYLKFFYSRFSNPLKAITWYPKKESGEERSQEDHGRKITVIKCEPVEYIINCLLNSVAKEDRGRGEPYISDVLHFILTNEESPADSLAEFEDMENIISASNSVVADLIDSVESQLDDEVESLPEEGELKEEEADSRVHHSKRRKKMDAFFKVTISTPKKKELFINYSPNSSSCFNISADSDQPGELCNSYIKTDDVNEDFENLSSDNPEFFSVGSPEKGSLNSSFGSTTSGMEVHVTSVTADQFCCVDCENNLLMKSPRSLAIIQEVDEGDSSTSSEVAPPSNPAR